MSENPFNNNNIYNQMQSIVDAIDSKPRIVQCIQCVNEEHLIEPCIMQLYDKVDKIIVVEGAVQNKVDAGQATADGHSIDNTVDVIKRIKADKDPDKKITFVQIDRPWADLEELKNTFFQYMQDGDWMLITDADEFIMPQAVDKLREAITLEPWATEFVPAGFYHFWRDVRHIRRPSGDWGQQHQRFIKFHPGMHYQNHPVARDKDGICTYFSREYKNRRFVLKDFLVYHYSYCRNDAADIQAKKDFYDKELGQDKHGDVGAYARGGQTDEHLNKTEDLDTVLLFGRDHPPMIEKHLAWHGDGVVSLDAHLQDKVFDDYKSAEPYNLENIPVCWIYDREGKPEYVNFFNTVDV